MAVIRILFVADTHLEFDDPIRPRIERRRRGPDFFRNFKTALKPALNTEVDGVVHGGDLLFRRRVPARLVDRAFEPLKRVADAGVPVYLVPGNHERSVIPYALLAALSWMQLGEREKAGTYLGEQLGDFPDGSWPTVIARYYLNRSLESRTIETANRERNKLVRGRMLFFIASALLLEDRVETALRYLLLVREIDRPDLPEKRIAGELLRGYGYED